MATACVTTSTLIDDESVDTEDVSVGDLTLSVLVADSAGERSQGLQGVDHLPSGVDGVLFVFDEPTSASFHMRTVGLPLDVWWFDSGGHLVGSARMATCLDGGCVSYPTPSPIGWALETPADRYELAPGSVLVIG